MPDRSKAAAVSAGSIFSLVSMSCCSAISAHRSSTVRSSVMPRTAAAWAGGRSELMASAIGFQGSGVVRGSWQPGGPITVQTPLGLPLIPPFDDVSSQPQSNSTLS